MAQQQILSRIKSRIPAKLRNKQYRAKFFRLRAQAELAYQLRKARKERNLTQPELEKLSGMKQSAISRMEQATYSQWNFQSLLKLADALDMRARIVLDDACDVIRSYELEESVSSDLHAGSTTWQNADGFAEGEAGEDLDMQGRTVGQTINAEAGV